MALPVVAQPPPAGLRDRPLRSTARGREGRRSTPGWVTSAKAPEPVQPDVGQRRGIAPNPQPGLLECAQGETVKDRRRLKTARRLAAPGTSGHPAAGPWETPAPGTLVEGALLGSVRQLRWETRGRLKPSVKKATERKGESAVSEPEGPGCAEPAAIHAVLANTPTRRPETVARSSKPRSCRGTGARNVAGKE